MTAHALVPSQVPGVRHRQGVRKSRRGDTTATARHAHADTDGEAAAGDSVAATARHPAAAPGAPEKKLATPRTGNVPDVHWRAIPLSHLRRHPQFRPLPPPDTIHTLPTKEHVRHFRQESWQWDYLHAGRCTTSQTSAALGFLEPKAAAVLDIPRSLRRGGAGAWERLRQVPADDQSLAAWEDILCEGHEAAGGPWKPGVAASARTWLPAAKLRHGVRTQPFPFVAKYVPKVTRDELHRRKLRVQQDHADPSPWSARMQWGNAQEATSVLTALNYFCGADPGATIHEVGMCGAAYSHPSLHGLRIGATPDGMIVHGNGTVEVLEVKNHCPFGWNKLTAHGARARQGGRRKHYTVRDFRVDARVPTAYIPQLMMEMLCVGEAFDLDHASETRTSQPVCTSAVMVRQTATKGAVLLRLRRDDAWLREMQYWLGEFQTRFVATGTVPPDNFFWDADPKSRYRMFLQRTKELSESVEQVAYIDNKKIQRMVLDRSFGVDTLIPLFLDNITKDDP